MKVFLSELYHNLQLLISQYRPFLILYSIAGMMCLFNILPLIQSDPKSLPSYELNDMIQSIPLSSITTGIIMLLTLLSWKSIELLCDIIHTQSRLLSYIPHRCGYMVTYTSSILGLGYALHIINAQQSFWYAHIAIQCAQVFAIAAYSAISSMTNPLPYSIMKLSVMQVILFGVSSLFLTWSLIESSPSQSNMMSEQHDHIIADSNMMLMSRNSYATLSALCSCGSFVMQGVYFALKSKMFISQFVSIDRVCIYRWECISFATINLIYHLARTLCTLSYHHQPEYLIISHYMIYSLYLIYFMMLPHRQITSYMNYTKDELEKRNNFVRIHLHDTRNPIATVVQGLDLLKSLFQTMRLSSPTSTTTTSASIYPLVENGEELVADMSISCSLAIQQLNDFLFYDKLQANTTTHGELDMNMISIKSFIQDCVRPYNIQAKSMNITLSVNYNMSIYDDISLYIDESKIRQVVHNLLSNAFKFTWRNSTIMVNIIYQPLFSRTPRWSQKYMDMHSIGVIRVEVVDAGIGISSSDMAKLFQQYSQINANKLQGGRGSGLGLWSSKTVVEQHGGIIGVQSCGEGQGSCFYFELQAYEHHQSHATTSSSHMIPIKQVHRRDRMTRRVHHTSSGSSPVTRSSLRLKTDVDHIISSTTSLTSSIASTSMKPTVLIVDDSIMSAKMMQRLLRDEYNVSEVAHDGSKAISCMKCLSPSYFDLIILDYNMPDMNGPQVCQMMRNMGYHGIILGVTASTSCDDRQEFIRHGANDVLVKPITLNTIRDTMMKITSQPLAHHDYHTGLMSHSRNNMKIF